jgi:16S rRNA (guanine966-N2)-methyltransferase
MRVIAGKLGGRNFLSPHTHRTRPMSDKVRGALFNSLGDISGLNVLDAFTGSGALAYEAISRGADNVVAIDMDKNAQDAILKNIRSLNLSAHLKLVKANAGSWLKTTDQLFDIVLCDPPYDDIQPILIIRLAQRLKPNGILVLSLPSNTKLNLGDEFTHLQEKKYGDASLIFYRRNT